MKILIQIVLLTTFSSNSYAYEMICQQVGRGNVSELKIAFDDQGTPKQLYLKSPDDSEFRLQDRVIDVLVSNKSQVLFTARKKNEGDTDWSREPQCFKEVGTIWYFTLDSERGYDQVQFYPEFVVENNRCVPPRFRPQTHKLDCH